MASEMGETPGDSSEERLWGNRMNSDGGAADHPHKTKSLVYQGIGNLEVTSDLKKNNFFVCVEKEK